MSFPLEFSGFMSNSEALICLMEMLRRLIFFDNTLIIFTWEGYFIHTSYIFQRLNTVSHSILPDTLINDTGNETNFSYLAWIIPGSGAHLKQERTPMEIDVEVRINAHQKGKLRR